MDHRHTTVTRRALRRCGAVAATAAALLALATTSASARPIDSTAEDVNETVSFELCGFRMSLHSVGTAAWTDKLRGGDIEGFQYLTPWFTTEWRRVTDTFTNLDTGRSFRNEVRGHSWDDRLLAVDGTQQTYRRFGTFHRTLYSQDERQYTSVGKYSYDYVYDTKGTPDPEDDTDTFIDGSYRQVGNGRDDFCYDVITYTS